MSAVSSWLAAKICLVSMPVVERQAIGAHLRGHHDFFERRVAGALADAVDRALDLPRAGGQRRERVGDREPEVVVAVRAEDRLVRVRHAADQSGGRTTAISSGVE